MCGLPGKRAVSLVGVGAKGLSGMDRENKRDGKGGKEGKGDGEVEILEEVANVLVKELAGLLKGVEGVKRIEEQDVLALDVDGSGKEAFEDEQRRLQEMVRRDV